MIKRLDAVSCAICMESLFCKRDDLDELCQIATPDCGHVFHEDCVREWFKTQAATHQAHQREIRGRSMSPYSDISDGPAECPTCRTECFADDATGEPLIHRLFINLEGSSGGEGSSQMGSSPMRAPSKKTRVKEEEEEVMGLARRAKLLGEDTKKLDVGIEWTSGQQVEVLLNRAEGLQTEVVSHKAIEGVKKYVGGLTAAMNKLRDTVATNPLTADLRAALMALQGKHAELSAKNAEAERKLKVVVDTLLPQEVASAVKAEKVRAHKEVKKVREDMEGLKRDLDNSSVLRQSAKREMEDRLKAEAQKTAEALIVAKKERAERESISSTLNERMKLLRRFQNKAESRKDEVEDLKKENATLRAQLELSSSASRRLPPAKPVYNDDSDEFDSMPPARPKSRKSIIDDSLDIELPSFAMSTTPSTSRPARPHPTARTLASDLFGSDSPKPKKRPLSSNHSKYFASEITSAPKAKANYLDDSDDDDEGFGFGSTYPDPDDESDHAAREAKRSRANPFASSRADTDRKKTLAPGKPSMSKPLQVTHSERKMETIDMCSSPESRPPLRTTKPNGSRPAAAASKPKPKTGNALGKSSTGKQPSIVESMGLADKNGRPVKGLAIGSKVRRKA